MFEDFGDEEFEEGRQPQFQLILIVHLPGSVILTSQQLEMGSEVFVLAVTAKRKGELLKKKFHLTDRRFDGAKK